MSFTFRGAFLSLTLSACCVVTTSTASIAAEGSAAPGPETMTFKPYEVVNPKPNIAKIKANKIEKPVLKFGIIKLTDCIPLVAARELGYFAEEGLSVTIEVQANWKVVQERVVNMELDGSHMLYNHPIGARIGYLGQSNIITPLNMCINGKGITVSNAIWKQMQEKDPVLKEAGYPLPVKADSLKLIAKERTAAGNPLRFGMTFPSGSHNITLRYWLAAGGVNPGFYEGPNDPVGKKDADVLLSAVPPPQMVANLTANTIDGYCVGEPWNQRAVVDGVGVAVNGDQYVFDGCPDKVFGVAEEWANKHPNTLNAVVKALIRANQWLDESPENRKLACEMLANKVYIGTNVEVLAESMMGTYQYQKGDRREAKNFNIFYKRFASFPFKSHAVWGLTQARRWGQIPTNRSDNWYFEVADQTFRTDIYRKAFGELLTEGKVKAEDLPADDYQTHPADVFIDKIEFDPKKPNDYVKKFAIGLK
jgi:nitrate/nitrite transport system substrate-binding protein